MSSAAISGQVTDDTGALVPGLEILIENLEMGVTRTLVTDFDGRYQASRLGLGEYRVARLHRLALNRHSFNFGSESHWAPRDG